MLLIFIFSKNTQKKRIHFELNGCIFGRRWKSTKKVNCYFSKNASFVNATEMNKNVSLNLTECICSYCSIISPYDRYFRHSIDWSVSVKRGTELSRRASRTTFGIIRDAHCEMFCAHFLNWFGFGSVSGISICFRSKFEFTNWFNFSPFLWSRWNFICFINLLNELFYLL